MPYLSRAELAKQAVTAELERHADEINGDANLKSFTIHVVMDVRAGVPLRTLYRCESETDLRPRPQR